MLLFVAQDCTSWPHYGTDCVPSTQHLRVSDCGVQSASVHHYGKRWSRQQSQPLLPAVWRPVQRDVVAEENEEYGSFKFPVEKKKIKHSILRVIIHSVLVCVYVDNVALFWVSKHISLWGSISFNLAVLVNIAVALFYPFGDDEDEGTCTDYYFSCTES